MWQWVELSLHPLQNFLGTALVTELTRERVDNMRSQTLRNPVLKGKKVRKTSGRVENEMDVEVRKG